MVLVIAMTYVRVMVIVVQMLVKNVGMVVQINLQIKICMTLCMMNMVLE